jgi:hypothetical protein
MEDRLWRLNQAKNWEFRRGKKKEEGGKWRLKKAIRNWECRRGGRKEEGERKKKEYKDWIKKRNREFRSEGGKSKLEGGIWRLNKAKRNWEFRRGRKKEGVGRRNKKIE